MKKIVLIILICMFVTSCTSVSQRVSSNPQPGKYQELGQADCSGCGVLFFDLIPIAWGGMTERAYKCAVESKGGDDLINPTITESWWAVPYFPFRCVNISGTVVKKQP